MPGRINGQAMIEIDLKIRIDGEGLDPEAVREWLGVPRLLRKIKKRMDEIREQQEKNMADLTAEFAALGEQLTRQATEIATEIQQLADAVLAGNVDRQTVEDARAKIVGITDQIKTSADALAADNPPAPPAP